jgi:3-oxoacyl-[acyl-carrier-protein] synthase II
MIGDSDSLLPYSCPGFCSMRAMATKFNDNPSKGSRPFDKDRCGFVMGEVRRRSGLELGGSGPRVAWSSRSCVGVQGAGVLVLESLEHAQKRGARIYAELAG